MTDSVSDSRGGVIQILRLDKHIADAKQTLFQLGEMDPARQVVEFHGEVGVLHLSRQRILKTALKADRRVDIQLRFRESGGREKGKAVDMIPVGVPYQQVNPPNPFLQQFLPKRPGSGSAIEKDDGAVTYP